MQVRGGYNSEKILANRFRAEDESILGQKEKMQK